ncbi:hypothetical protein [Streptomyces sp. NBC_01314]|uniref:hypothetical protein n=1 Tax=Streptomyces sp. NBC_01314 TaxID=2903821 RepID=UPI003089EE71|nr:hypothetical protein OG622_49305 [Streptomyces sp. NBC_01314]
MRAVVRQAVRDVRPPRPPPPPPADPSVDPTLAALRAVVVDLGASTHTIGEPMLEVAPAYLSDTAATDVLTSFTATPARKLTPGEEDANRVLAIERAPSERGSPT